MRQLLLLISILNFPILALTQNATCPYPIIMLHGWTGSNESWDDFYQDSDIENIYGVFDENDQVFWAMPNATDTHDYYTDCCTFLCFFDCEYVVDSTLNDDINGPDGIFDNNATDDDVQWVFPNENNNLISGCLYAYSFNVGKNSDGTIFKNSVITSTAPCDDCSDNNEAAAYKQGYALKRVIEAVLAANPDKSKVILMAHSMGGLCAREYLQRQDHSGNPTWWVDPITPDGHKVAKLITLGTPHRGSNTLGNLTFNESQNRNDLPDLRSEAIRDLRYSYEDGSTSIDIPGTYLYGGLESDISDFLFSYWSKDVNCDGDKNDVIVGLNIDGQLQGLPDVWDGTSDNPLMPLPMNIKYTYYVSDADGAVDETRQWLFEGGSGSVSDYNAGLSFPIPFDGVAQRRSDRINVSRFHLNQTDDIEHVVQAIDEADYPAMAYDINLSTWYFGLVQERATLVPDSSDYSLTGNNLIDGDWYVFTMTDTFYSATLKLLPHQDISGRLDFYSLINDSLSNHEIADTFIIWNTNQLDTIGINLPSNNYQPGKYYIRISHDLTSATSNISDLWKMPYTFKIDVKRPCIENLFISGTHTLDQYRVDQTITSDAFIKDSGLVKFQAGESINLIEGFEVGQAAEFQARIDTCQ